MNAPGRTAILVIDPDPSVRSLILALLRRQGYVAEAAADRDEALGRDPAAYGAIVVDPRIIGGDSLLDALQSGGDGAARRKLIVVTTPDHRRSTWGRHPGVHAVLFKPFGLDDLAAAIAACCGRKG